MLNWVKTIQPLQGKIKTSTIALHNYVYAPINMQYAIRNSEGVLEKNIIKRNAHI